VYAQQQAMWMHHTWGPRFHSGTIGYNRDTSPNRSPSTTRYPKLKEEEFLGKRKAFVNSFENHFGNIVLNPLFCKFCKEEGYNLWIFKINATCLK